MKRIVSVLLSLLLLAGVCGCSSEKAREQVYSFVGAFQNITGSINYEDARKLTDDFLDAVVNGDYELAESYWHPERREKDLKEYFDNFTTETSIDLSDGIGAKLYSDETTVGYDSTVDGATYAAEFMVKSNKKTVKISLEIVKNDIGYGLYNFSMEPMEK